MCNRWQAEHPLPDAQDRGGILPGLQKLSYAGKNFEDSQRKLEQCVMWLHGF